MPPYGQTRVYEHRCSTRIDRAKRDITPLEQVERSESSFHYNRSSEASHHSTIIGRAKRVINPSEARPEQREGKHGSDNEDDSVSVELI
jgi:hypothetical protein